MSKFKVGDTVRFIGDHSSGEFTVQEIPYLRLVSNMNGYVHNANENLLELVPETVTLTIEPPKEVVEELAKDHLSAYSPETYRALNAALEAIRKVAN